jgi:hypothetical protein
VVVVATAAEEEDVASRTPVEGKALRGRIPSEGEGRKNTRCPRQWNQTGGPASSRIAAEGQGMQRKEMREQQEVMAVEEQEPMAVVVKEALFGKRWWNWWPFLLD